MVASRPTPRYPHAPEMTPTVMINPSFRPFSTTQEKDWEGCLSIPGIPALVPRYTEIEVSYIGSDGNSMQQRLKGFPARVFQHEYDHLNGLVYLDRVESNRDIISEKEFIKLVQPLFSTDTLMCQHFSGHKVTQIYDGFRSLPVINNHWWNEAVSGCRTPQYIQIFPV